MRFGIFVFGDNHPELGRPNRQYYEEVLTIAEWAEELGFDIISNNIGRGIDVTEASSVRVGGISETTASANTITFNGNHGIRARDSSSADISRNTITNNAADGIRIERASAR